ncbi:TenA family protein [Sphingobacterium sp. LRF_L2]|uniref:TenA family protein n=1 Tax=Sphingobacterium sp. LRF_L2 TaxID=3369421 RepID=UPI003F611431
MKWTDNAWKEISNTFKTIQEMPFIEELKLGTLPLDKFQFYMLQDARYLEHFGRVLAYLGSKCSQNDQALAFFDFAKNALIVEQALHESYFEQFGIKKIVPIETEPICHHYIHFLKSTAAFEPLEVGIAAVLPCFWIYKAIGDYIYEQQSKTNNPYSNWIQTYSGEDFSKSVMMAIDYVDQMADQTTETIRQSMLNTFEKASLLEYHFWQAAYDKKTWKIS